MRSTAWKIAGVGLGIAVAAIAIGFYVGDWLLSAPPTYDAQTSRTSARITIQTVAAVGPQLSAEPGLGLVPDPQAAGELAAQHDLDSCRRTRSCTSRSTSSTATAACAIRSSRRTQGLVGNGDARRQAVRADRAGQRVAHVRDSAARRARPAPGRGRRREEPVRLRAVRPDDAWLTGRSRSRSAPAKKGQLPLAVLRPLRRRLQSTASAGRCRRSATWTASSTWSRRRWRPIATRPRNDDVRHGRASSSAWLVLSLDRDAARRDLCRPADPARQRDACRRRDRSSTTR